VRIHRRCADREGPELEHDDRGLVGSRLAVRGAARRLVGHQHDEHERRGGFTRPTAGTVAYLSGSTLYVTNSEGNTIKVTTNAGTSVTKTVAGTVKGIHPGETVTVTGSTGSDGAVGAESISLGSSASGLAGLFGSSRSSSSGSTGGSGASSLFGG
jgi:hypothetical protein